MQKPIFLCAKLYFIIANRQLHFYLMKVFKTESNIFFFNIHCKPLQLYYISATTRKLLGTRICCSALQPDYSYITAKRCNNSAIQMLCHPSDESYTIYNYRIQFVHLFQPHKNTGFMIQIQLKAVLMHIRYCFLGHDLEIMKQSL